MATQASGASSDNPNTWLTINGRPLSFVSGDTNLGVDACDYKQNRISVTQNAPRDIEIYADGQTLDTRVYGEWIWNPEGYAGIYRIEVRAPGVAPQTVQVRVQPGKLNHERYLRMLEEVARTSIDLLFELDSPVHEHAFSTPLEDKASALRDYKQILDLFEQLPDVLENIARNPLTKLVEINETRLLQHVERFTSDVTPLPGEYFSTSVNNYTQFPSIPLQWLVRSSSPTYDVPENRLLKHFLWRQLLPRINNTRIRAEHEIERRKSELAVQRAKLYEQADSTAERINELQAAVQQCRLMSRECENWVNVGYLSHLGTNIAMLRPTQVLQKHPHYNRFYRLYLDFQQKLRISWNTEQFTSELHMRKIWEIYQLWSVLRMALGVKRMLLKDGYRIKGTQGIFRMTEDEFHLDIVKGAQIELVKQDTSVRLCYEPEYFNYRTIQSGIVATRGPKFNPDMTIEVWRGKYAEKLIVFDAKYKWFDLGDGQQSCVEDDIAKMYLYAGEIRYKPGTNQLPEDIASSAYTLFPGNVILHDPDRPRVGALPMCPGQSETIWRETAKAVKDILQNAGLI